MRARYKLRHDAPVKRAFCLLLMLLLAAAAPAEKRGAAGSYRLVGEQDVASGLVLWPDGRFEYFLSAGALDEHAEGRWSVAGGVVTMITDPKPVPPVFTPSPPGKADGVALTVVVSSPEGRGIAGVDLRIGFDSGAPIEGYTQEDGWSLPEDEKRTARWIELAVPMHDLRSPRFPIDLAAGNALAFTLVANDMGIFDFTGVGVRMAGKALVVDRGGGGLLYERVRGR